MKLQFLRNPEVRFEVGIHIVLTAIVCTVTLLIDVNYGIGLIPICLFFDFIFISSTYRRYKKIADLSYEIDKVLHGREFIHLDEYAEGEMAILRNEIVKMTVRLREQTDSLQNDKVHLADSIANISHQIRTPLTSIHFIVSFLAQSDLSDEKRMELIKELSGLLSRIDWLISSLLKLARLDAGRVVFQKEEIEVKKLVEKALEPILIPIELKEQNIAVQIEENVKFTGDFSWSSEAVGNILKNCMEHTPEQGSITVAACENTIFTEITISDNGKGIEKEDIPYLFDRFYKGKNSSGSSIGIGLALSRMIIASQNGTIKAENQKQGGAIFTIRFYKSVV